MFKHLRTKLTVLYAALLGAALLLISAVVYSAITTNVERLVRQELEASATVFDRLWTLRAQQLRDSALVLSRDFGFREALATGDEATVRSALANLRGRSSLDLALIVGTDGRVTAADGRRLDPMADDLLARLESEEAPSGVLMVDGVAYMGVSAPILSPILTGWVVFGARLDDAEMNALETLSAIPHTAALLTRRADDWTSLTGDMDPRDEAAIRTGLQELPRAGHAELGMDGSEGRSIAIVRSLPSLDAGGPYVLMLRYPLARALAPYRPLIDAMLATGALGVAVLLFGSWALARGVTQPISALDEAAQRLKRGEDASVQVRSKDEIGRLAESFNVMAAEIRERERRLAAALARAESANRLTGEFLANMSHEIRTPLNGVLGLAQVLARTSRDQAQRELTSAILDSAGALERLLCDILEASQLRAGAAQISLEPFALASTVEAVAGAWGDAAREKGLAFKAHVAPGVDTVVLGDAARLQQVLSAILGNAVKFTSAGEIRLTAAPSARGFRFEVSDTGVGIDPARKEQIFSAFGQADGSATRRHGGAGLGLSVALGLVELMGGTLDCAPREGGGSLFWVELPLRPVAPVVQAVA